VWMTYIAALIASAHAVDCRVQLLALHLRAAISAFSAATLTLCRLGCQRLPLFRHRFLQHDCRQAYRCGAEVSAGWTRNLYLLPDRYLKPDPPGARDAAGIAPYVRPWQCALKARITSGGGGLYPDNCVRHVKARFLSGRQPHPAKVSIIT
jgi:hypothetical protein